MEEKEQSLIIKLSEQHHELKKLWDEHLGYEKKLKEFERKPHLSPEEEIEKKKIQKMKLAGKDKIFELLTHYTVKEN